MTSVQYSTVVSHIPTVWFYTNGSTHVPPEDVSHCSWPALHIIETLQLACCNVATIVKMDDNNQNKRISKLGLLSVKHRHTKTANNARQTNTEQ